MKRLYESLLDDEDILMNNSDNAVNDAKFKRIEKYYLKEILQTNEKDNQKYGPLVILNKKNDNTQLKHWHYISARAPFITFVDKFYTDTLSIVSNDVYESNFKDKKVVITGWTNGLHPKLQFKIPNVSTLENVNIKCDLGLSMIALDHDFKSFKNCKFEMGADDAYVDSFQISVGMSKINDWKAFKGLTIVNKTPNNKYNRLTIKAWDTELANNFFRNVKKFKPNTQSKADYEEIQRTAMNYFYKEIEPNINHIPGLSAIHMFVDGGWNTNYNITNKKWRGFIKDLETGEWTYIDKFNAYKENIFKN